MDENQNKAPNTYNQTFMQGAGELTKLEKLLFVGMAVTGVMMVVKVRSQHKQLERTFDLLGTSLDQVAALTAQRAAK